MDELLNVRSCTISFILVGIVGHGTDARFQMHATRLERNKAERKSDEAIMKTECLMEDEVKEGSLQEEKKKLVDVGMEAAVVGTSAEPKDAIT